MPPLPDDILGLGVALGVGLRGVRQCRAGLQCWDDHPADDRHHNDVTRTAQVRGLAAAAALVASWRAFSISGDGHKLAGKRPFEPMRVLAFVAILATILLLAAIARRWLGESSLPWVLAAAGLADVHAAAASAAQLVASEQIRAEQALVAVLAALAANSLMKCVLAPKGGWRYAMRIIPGSVLMVVAFAVTMAVAKSGGAGCRRNKPAKKRYRCFGFRCASIARFRRLGAGGFASFK